MEARNRDLDKRLREEQALKEAAQAKLKALKKKVGEENGTHQKKSKVAESTEKADAPTSETKKVSNEGQLSSKQNPAPATEGPAPATEQFPTIKQAPAPANKSPESERTTLQPTVPAVPKKNKGLESQSAKTKPPRNHRNDGIGKPKTGTALMGADPVESAVTDRNLAALESQQKKMATTTKKPTKRGSDGNILPRIDRQTSNESADLKVDKPAAIATGTLRKETSINVVDVDSPQLLPTQISEAAHSTAAPGSKSNSYALSEIQRPPSAGAKIPSAIEFDPLKTEKTTDLGVDTQSVSSITGLGFTAADVGLGNGGGPSVQPQYAQSFEVPTTVFPVVSFANQSAGLMGYEQQQQQHHSVHSFPLADVSQPMYIIHPHHIRGGSMHEFSAPETLPQQQQPQAPMSTNNMGQQQPQNLHNRVNSFRMPNNMVTNPLLWNEQSNAQQQLRSNTAATAGNGGIVQQQQQQPPQNSSGSVSPDPFDELVTRRPVSAMNGGK